MNFPKFVKIEENVYKVVGWNPVDLLNKPLKDWLDKQTYRLESKHLDEIDRLVRMAEETDVKSRRYEFGNEVNETLHLNVCGGIVLGVFRLLASRMRGSSEPSEYAVLYTDFKALGSILAYRFWELTAVEKWQYSDLSNVTQYGFLKEFKHFAVED